MKLDVESVAAQRSFVFLWCGSAEGLDQGRAVRMEKKKKKKQGAICCNLVLEKMGLSTM